MMRRSLASRADVAAVGRRSLLSKVLNSSIIGLRSLTRRSVIEPQEVGNVDLAERLKTELRGRFAKGERPTAAEYLVKYPEIAADKNKVLSLIYEEYCLLEEINQSPETIEFCERYADWTNSLQEQLQFHKIFSQVADPPLLASSARYPEPAEQFATFLILSEIGQGGAARVYLASDEDLGRREVVLKVSADRGNEASIQGRLSHPNIVPVLSVARQSESNLRGLCMPYRPGRPLDQVIEKLFESGKAPDSAIAIWRALAPAAGKHPEFPEGPGWDNFPIEGTYSEGVAWIIQHIADALHYAHLQGIFHRDVKPANILLTTKEGPQLLDFNLAHAPHSPEAAAVALRGGTLPYMAPEQLRAFRNPECWNEVTGSSDVYSLGLVTRELLMGKPPIVQDPRKPLPQTISELLESRTSAHPWPSLRQSNAKIPHALEAIVDLCLVGDPKLRYRSAEDLAGDLRRFVEHQPLAVAKNPSRPERTSNWVGRNRRILVLASAAAMLMMILGAVQLTKWLTPHENRREFTTLVKKFEAHSILEARTGLLALKSQGMDFPLLWLYLGATYKDSVVPNDCQDHLATIWADPAAVDKLKTWSGYHPGFVGHVEQLAIDLYKQNATGNPDRDLPRKRTAADTIKFVQTLEPDRDLARQVRAVILEDIGDYATSDRLYTELIVQLSGSADPQSQSKLLPVLETRTRTAMKWLEASVEGKVKTLEPADARALLQRTFEDLERSGTIITRLETIELIDPVTAKNFKFRADYLLCEARLIQGDFLKGLGRTIEAREAYSQSSRVLIEISPGALESDFFARLAERIRARL